jgi:hypothetical protein
MNPLYVIYILTVWVPAAVFYGWIAVFAWFAWKQREDKWRAAILVAIGMAPCVIYADQYLTAYVKHQRMVAAIERAQQWPKLSNPPRTLVIHGAPSIGGGGDKWHERLVEMGAFDEVYLTQIDKPIRLTNERSAACGDFRDWMRPPDIYRARAGLLTCAVGTSVARAPDEGLHLYLGPAPRASPGPLGPVPLPISQELRLISGGRQQIIGYWAIPYVVDYPAFPPILTTAGFYPDLKPLQSQVVPNDGELSFLFERLELKPEDFKPRNLPSPNEIRAEFIRRRDSPDRAQQKLAGMIAAAVGASALNANDVEPVLVSDAIDRDFAGEIGHEQFCLHIDRLCDFRESLIAICKQKRVRQKLPEAKCDRLPQQCNWCAEASLCRPRLFGKTTGCSPADAAAREAFLAPLRQGYP